MGHRDLGPHEEGRKVGHTTRGVSGPTFVSKLLFVVLFACCLLLDGMSSISCVVVDGTRKDEISALRNQKSNETQNIDQFNTRTCGMADPNPDEHEFLNMAREGQFPWFVSFQIKIMSGLSFSQQIKESNKTVKETKEHAKGSISGSLNEPHKREDLHFCSGAFISDKWVLSAAHCFADETLVNYMRNDKLKAVAGSHKVSSRSSINKNLTIKRIYRHSKFNKSMPIGFDIALVELEERVNLSRKRQQNDFGEQLGPFMNAICLPKRDNQYKENDTARIAGWGSSMAKDAHTMPSKLLFTDILLADKANCSATYSKRLKSEAPVGRDDFLCASYKTTRDSCQADSGGPLMQYVRRKAVAIGIVSYGIACATQGVPGVYTRTSAYNDWIEDITRNGPEAKVEFIMTESDSGREKQTTTSTPTTTTKTTTSTTTTTTTTTTRSPKTTRTTTSKTETSSKPTTTTTTSTTSIQKSDWVSELEDDISGDLFDDDDFGDSSLQF